MSDKTIESLINTLAIIALSMLIMAAAGNIAKQYVSNSYECESVKQGEIDE